MLVLDRLALAGERWATGEHLERDHAERVEISAVIHRATRRADSGVSA